MSRRNFWVITPLACIVALGFGSRGFGQAHDEDHAMSPLEGLTKLYKYPDGSKEIEEKLSRPAQNIEAVENVETLLRSPTGVDPELAADDAVALKPYLRSSAQMPISAAQGAEGPVARNEAVYTYGYTYKETQLSEETSQQVVTHETRTVKRPVIVSERNVPSGQELNGLDVAQARRKLEEERGGLKDQLEQIGVEKSSRDYKDAGLKANVYVDRKNDPPRLEIRKLKDKPARLVWTYIVKSDNLKFPLSAGSS